MNKVKNIDLLTKVIKDLDPEHQKTFLKGFSLAAYSSSDGDDIIALLAMLGSSIPDGKKLLETIKWEVSTYLDQN